MFVTSETEVGQHLMFAFGDYVLSPDYWHRSNEKSCLEFVPH